MWILGSFKKEASFFFVPGLLSVLIAISFPHLGESSLLYGLLATALIDSGHVYTTAWRTFFHKEERQSSRALYLLFPVFFFLIFFIWFATGARGLWMFVVYSTLFHHIRQVYGFSKWYQALNKRSDQSSDFFLYSLALIPIIAYHFRPGAIANYYTMNDLFLFPQLDIFKSFIMIYATFLSGWIIYELRSWKQGKREINRIFSIAFPAFIYGYCFFFGKTLTQTLFPLLFIHGVSYCAVISQSLYRTQPMKFKNLLLSSTIVIVTAVLFGLTESWMESHIPIDSPGSILGGVLVGFWLTPLFCHYLFDAIIWKRNHRESAKVLGQIH
jgi:hypothetical protein